MDGKHAPYNFVDSLKRLDEILGQPGGQFEEVSELPDRDRLTFTNGFYAQWCTAVFVDIRDSSSLPEHYAGGYGWPWSRSGGGTQRSHRAPPTGCKVADSPGTSALPIGARVWQSGHAGTVNRSHKRSTRIGCSRV